MTEETFIPDWTNDPPAPGSYRSIVKIGRPDQIKLPSPEYFHLIQKELKLDRKYFEDRCDGNQRLGPVPASNVDTGAIEAFIEMVGSENVQADDFNRVKYSYGKLPEETFPLKRGKLHEITGAVVHPRDKEDVRKLVGFCNEKKIPIYVYGGGSGTTKALLPEKGGITLVLNTHMNKVLEVNELNSTSRVQAGCMGPQYEEALNNAPQRYHTVHRFTGGHFPQSWELSSVGGWVVTSGSGQASTYYGEPVNLVLSVEVVTPRGVINTIDYPSTATGPRVIDMFKGSEGSFGVVVELTMKVFRYMPENRKYFSYIFPTWPKAIDAAREICQGQFGLPAVLRVSDAEETDHAFQMYPQKPAVEWFLGAFGLKRGRRSICMGIIEGDKDFAKLVKKKMNAIAKSYGGLSIGGSGAKTWEKERYLSFLIGETISDYNILLDTIETPVRWDNVHHIHDSVMAYAHSVPGTMCISHASHFYPYGTNLYFIFGVKGSLEDYISYRTGLVDAMVKAGGTPSHHHGVGRLMNQWMESFLGKEEMDAL
ncbi:MAG: FAD-binding oxidoreductase, partial [Dehalococcoidia bacterium]